jgi:hypothetical protein
MSALRFPEWQRPCEEALSESDPQKLIQRVLVAETAIFDCLHNRRSRPEKIELDAMDKMLEDFLVLISNTFMLSEEKAMTRLLQIPGSRLRAKVPRGILRRW